MPIVTHSATSTCCNRQPQRFSLSLFRLRLHLLLLAISLNLPSGTDNLANGQSDDARAGRAEQGDELVALKVETLVEEVDGGTGGLAIDNQGNLYTADFGWRLDGQGKGGDQIFKIDPQGNVSLLCRQMRGASGNTIDADGNLYQSSVGGNFISRVDPEGHVTVVARDGLRNPVGLTFGNDDALYVCNCGSNSILRVTLEGESDTFCDSELLRCPNGITLADNGKFYVANFANGDVIEIDGDGNATKLASLPGDNNGHLIYYGEKLYVVARSAHQIYSVTLEGDVAPFVGSGNRGKEDGDPAEASLSLPNDLAISPDGRFMYINETGPVEGDPRVLGPTRIRRAALSDAPR